MSEDVPQSTNRQSKNGQSDPTMPGPYDWADHYTRGDTPWDLGAAHPDLIARIAAGEFDPPKPGARALVPGCGKGHDALALAQAGWTVVALDYVPEVQTILGAQLAKFGGQVILGDALDYSPDQPFDLIWEHTFFCAIDPTDRERYADLIRRALVPDGKHAAIVFPLDKPVEEGGPPHGFNAGTLDALLGEEFRRVIEEPVGQGVGKRSRPERYSLLKRRRG
jgi:methyl halide transferase